MSIRPLRSKSLPPPNSTSGSAPAPVRRRPVEYPSSDGKPMAETGIHGENLLMLLGLLQVWFRDQHQTAYVGANNFLYFEEGNPKKVLAPDVYVVREIVQVPYRDSWKVWVEGRAPDLVIELTSRKTRKEDTGKKLEIYRDVLRVSEYILFDPYGDYLNPSLQGYRLVRGEYRPIRMVDGRLPSRVLGLELERGGLFLRLRDPATGRWRPTLLEAHEFAEDAAREVAEAEARAAAAEARVRELEERVRQLQSPQSQPVRPKGRTRRKDNPQ